MKTYPTTARIIIAEDVRQEVGGKQTVVGIYAGDDIRFQRPRDLPEDARPSLSRFTVYAIFTGGEGEFVAKVEVVAPSGKITSSAGPFQAKKIKDTNMIVNCTWAPMQFPENGKYKARILIDDKDYVQEFLVVDSAPAEPKEAAKPAAKAAEKA